MSPSGPTPSEINTSDSKFSRLMGITRGSDIYWAHATNTYQLVMDALDDFLSQKPKKFKAYFLEADVIVLRNQPHMGHDPFYPGDLTFADLIRLVEKFKEEHPTFPLGLKFDFKTEEAIAPALRILTERSEYAKIFQTPEDPTPEYIPLWLNADIFRGPLGRPPLFNPTTFTAICLAAFPDAVLSLGWTTGTDMGSYSRGMVDQMLSFVETLPQGVEITFPVRASLVAPSWPQLRRLLASSSGRRTLTIWGAADPSMIRWWADNLPPSTYVDVRMM